MGRGGAPDYALVMSQTQPASPGFDELQRAMAERLGRRGVSDLATGTIVVLPSITFPPDELVKIIGIEHYEERMLCMTLLLRRPSLEMVYVTSAPVDEAVVDYYLSFVPDAGDARSRLHMISVDNTEPRALSEKLLEHPETLERIRSHIPEDDNSFLFPFNVTELESRLSEELGVGLYGPSPSLALLGSKSGSRRIAAQAGVPVPPGAEDLWSLDEIEHAAFRLVDEVPGCEAIVMKLNNGFSGQGNVIIEAAGLRSPLTSSDATFCAREETWETFSSKIAREGGIVEQLVRGRRLASPSVQLRVFPDGEYEVVSTHDQILGGPDDQVYLGCRFPADERYRPAIQGYGLGIARELAGHGVIGSFGVDFIVPADGEIFMSEINLRLGGTTHPFLMARFVTEGAYDVGTGELMVGDERRVYVATDNIKSEKLVGRSAKELITLLEREGLAFDALSVTGVTLHLLGATERHGKLGAVCIGRDVADADRMYEDLLAALET